MLKRQRESDAGEGGPPDADGRPGGGASDTVRQLGQSVLKGMREIQQMKDENVGAKPLVWVDCDPGGDDTFALMWLFALQNKGHCKVIGISTSEGNVRAPLTYAAADKVAMICQSKTQICAQTPLEARFGTHEERRAARLRAKQDASVSGGDATHIHGSDGMGGLSHRMQGSGNEYEDAAESYEALSEALFQYPRQLVLLVIGPHTNLHDAETHEPGIMMLTRDIIIMGGAFNVGGNITPTSEFNIWKDPQAAQTVIQGKGKKSIMIMPLDVTAKMVLTKDLVDQMTRQPTTIDPGAMYTCDVLGKAAFLNDLAQFMIKSNMGFRCTKGQTGFLVHDASYAPPAGFQPASNRWRLSALPLHCPDLSSWQLQPPETRPALACSHTSSVRVSVPGPTGPWPSSSIPSWSASSARPSRSPPTRARVASRTLTSATIPSWAAAAGSRWTSTPTGRR